jgi:hypothetical protein
MKKTRVSLCCLFYAGFLFLIIFRPKNTDIVSKTKVRTLLSLEESLFLGMTTYFLPDINAMSTALSNKSFFNYIFLFRWQFYFVDCDLKIIGHGNSDSNLESQCVALHSSLCQNFLKPKMRGSLFGVCRRLNMV